jgi:hypothetical protein
MTPTLFLDWTKHSGPPDYTPIPSYHLKTTAYFNQSAKYLKSKSPIKLVVASTDLPLAELEEAMAPGVSKPAGVPQAWDVRHLENGAIPGTLRSCFYSKSCWALRFHVCNKDN